MGYEATVHAVPFHFVGTITDTARLVVAGAQPGHYHVLTDFKVTNKNDTTGALVQALSDDGVAPLVIDHGWAEEKGGGFGPAARVAPRTRTGDALAVQADAAATLYVSMHGYTFKERP